MDINRFTQKAQEALSSSQTKAVRYGHQQVDVEHLFASLLEQERGLASSLLNKTGIEVDGSEAASRAGTQPHAQSNAARQEDPIRFTSPPV